MIFVNIKKDKRAVFLMILFISFIFLLFSFSVLAAEGVNKALEGLNTSASKGFLGEADTKNIDEDQGVITSLPNAIGTVVGAGLAFIGVLFFLLIIYGGLLWMTARGNEADVEKAKNLIQAAVVGLIIVLGAYAITSYISELLK